MEEFAVRLEALPEATVVRVQGDLDLATTPHLRETLEDVDRGGRLVIDLSGCTFLDSSAVQVLTTAAREAQPSGRAVAVVAPDPAISRVLEITGVDRIVEVHRSLDEAL